MRLRRLLLIAVGAMLSGWPVIGSDQMSGAAQDQSANSAPLGSEQNPVKVASGVMAGLIIHRVTPQYPIPVCGDPAYSGPVVTRANISPEGKVDKLTVISGPVADREANLKALRQWTYKPYLLNGTAVWVQTVITININFGRCEPKSSGI